MSAPSRSHLVISDDLAGVARNAANLFATLAQSAAGQGRFSVALSGGSTPKALHQLLAASPYRDQIPWSLVHFFWGDERTVPPDDPASNYHMARETLLDHLSLRTDQVHRMRTELPPEQAAAEYEQDLRSFFGLAPGQLPRFDLILLGMGPDGHTASLFPQTAALHARDRPVVANVVPQQNTTRVTLTYPVLNNASTVAFLVAGDDKANVLAAVLEGPRDLEHYPSQGIAPTDGDLYWFVDRAAAARLRLPEAQS